VNPEKPRKARPDAEKWAGGYIRRGKKAPTYIIDRWVGGVHFHVSTRCHSVRPALKQLERFEEDPIGYHPAGNPGRQELVMTAKLILEYRDWMEDEKGTTREWANETARYLNSWLLDLDGKDLRDVSMQHDLKPALQRRKTCRRHRIEAIKSFYSWLRKERGLLTHGEDPTLDLPVPQVVAEKLRRRKVVEREWVLKVLPHLPTVDRDVLVLQLGTAWHVSEVRRFAASGEIQLLEGAPLAVISTRHKSREPASNALQYPEHLEAAQRLRALGRIPCPWSLASHLKSACSKAGVPQFRNGVMRHSVLTWGREMGASIQQASEFAHHKSPTTTRQFYLDARVPVVSIPVLRLVQGEKKTA
jgi:hypothetical protein